MVKSDDWSTPPHLMAVLHEEFNFTLEVCASKDNRAIPNVPYMGLDNGKDALELPWDCGGVDSVSFCNPPYSMLSAFTKRATVQPGTRVLLIPAYIGTNYWQDVVVPTAHEVWILKGRLTFFENGEPGPYPARFDSAIVIWKELKGFGPAVIRTWDWRQNL